MGMYLLILGWLLLSNTKSMQIRAMHPTNHQMIKPKLTMTMIPTIQISDAVDASNKIPSEDPTDSLAKYPTLSTIETITDTLAMSQTEIPILSAIETTTTHLTKKRKAKILKQQIINVIMMMMTMMTMMTMIIMMMAMTTMNMIHWMILKLIVMENWMKMVQIIKELLMCKKNSKIYNAMMDSFQSESDASNRIVFALTEHGQLVAVLIALLVFSYYGIYLLEKT